MTIYQVRRNASPKSPTDNGQLVQQFQTFTEAKAYRKKLYEQGDRTAFVSIKDVEKMTLYTSNGDTVTRSDPQWRTESEDLSELIAQAQEFAKKAHDGWNSAVWIENEAGEVVWPK